MKKSARSEGDQYLGLVKFLSWSSLALILLVNLFLSIFLSNYARQDVLSKQKEFALLLAENLNHQIYQRFTLPTVIGFGRVELSQPAQYDRLEKTVLSTIHSFHVSEVRIYDFDKRVSFSTDKELVGQTGYAGTAILESLEQGTSSFQLVSRTGMLGGILDFNPKPDSVILRTIYPLRTERSLVPGNPQGFIMGVLEFTQDITTDYQKVVDFQRIIIGTSLASSILLFIMLRIIISRAGRINAQRIQEREQLERELQQQEKLAGMGRMVAGIAHEIRNPLGIIRSTAELLLKRNKETDGVNARLLSAIFDESKRLSKTVGDFLDYARPKAPKQEVVDLAVTLDQALVFLEAKCEELGVAVTKDYSAGLNVRGDKDLLYRAVYNVLSNALDSLAEDREKARPAAIAVAATADATAVTLAITDSGPGFCPENKDRLLDPFFTTKDAGTGLGLAIVRNIVESHNAALSLENAPDAGARVTMTFPPA
ncbi:integral membrane sensor signal transduction histidine kinase [Solidesulfovibrio carbinoliphilus subsp. oakridgensis]|uniref:histidine kinase n=1 Tax=Solidesulfovibrio carbinoliphilus subsp. oakridgensis TaxID=694327 RepID=G7Q578_9BACT|nr:ATP-binding protein [Solidesulfovibrio carbinoliphilus]EHJ48401.1 integral membrane sensor signal transduction histidine kinase [Solidesulfovibrio carbinoliphilus subsp. oakridgensis]